jgi:hypothetical protein
MVDVVRRGVDSRVMVRRTHAGWRREGVEDVILNAEMNFTRLKFASDSTTPRMTMYSLRVPYRDKKNVWKH